MLWTLQLHPKLSLPIDKFLDVFPSWKIPNSPEGYVGILQWFVATEKNLALITLCHQTPCIYEIQQHSTRTFHKVSLPLITRQFRDKEWLGDRNASLSFGTVEIVRRIWVGFSVLYELLLQSQKHFLNPNTEWNLRWFAGVLVS